MPIMMLIVEILLIIIGINWKTWKQTENCQRICPQTGEIGLFLAINPLPIINKLYTFAFFFKKRKNPGYRCGKPTAGIENFLKTTESFWDLSTNALIFSTMRAHRCGKTATKKPNRSVTVGQPCKIRPWKQDVEIAIFWRYNKEKRLWHLFCHSLLVAGTGLEPATSGLWEI